MAVRECICMVIAITMEFTCQYCDYKQAFEFGQLERYLGWGPQRSHYMVMVIYPLLNSGRQMNYTWYYIQYR
jgi:hypothetical protein